MAQLTHFSVNRGTVVSDCLPQTQQFIDQNLNYFIGPVTAMAEALGETEDVTFASCEDQWTVACKVSKTELGRIAAATGVLRDGGSQGHIEEVLNQVG